MLTLGEYHLWQLPVGPNSTTTTLGLALQPVLYLAKSVSVQAMGIFTVALWGMVIYKLFSNLNSRTVTYA